MGPYKSESVRLEVEVLEPESTPMRIALEQMRDEGFQVPPVSIVRGFF